MRAGPEQLKIFAPEGDEVKSFMGYKKVDAGMDFGRRELETLKFWKEHRIFEKTREQSEGKPAFTFYDGPPTANGKPHIGHILTRVMKDIIPRYKTMKGFSVLRKAGWDTHGLPVELEVEKLLQLDGKQDIEKYGIEPFIQKCKESVWKYKGEWERMSDRVGYWVDMEHPYVTYDDTYIESVWWSLKQLADRGLIYKGHKVVPYCPRCGTALSSHEVAQGYKDVKEKSVFAKFRKKGEEKTFFLAWTTTPWTLPSNVALCMNADEDYAEIACNGERYILARALVPSLFEEGSYEVLSVRKGREYEGAEYLPLFDWARPDKKACYVVNDSYVTLTDGTGIVHIAPAFGEDDARVGQKYGLPFVQLVNERGCFKPEAAPLSGMFAKEADKVIIGLLKESGALFKEQLYEHSYPYCWRCDTPLIYYARSTWFIKVTAVKEELLKANASVNWIPPAIGTGRMGNFLENVIDWGLSRERYWGTPLPIWVCDKCGKMHVMGSKAELKEKCGLSEDVELHRPYIDKPTFACECGGTFRRTPEVIDCWYDSGSMPFAQHHYPFENEELFKRNFPADFISEAVDQTRGWFYTLLAISTLLFGKAPFKNCIVLGHVNDKNGQKMSKHKGNVVDPWTVLDKQGADAVRWYFYTNSNPWLPSRFYPEAVDEVQRKFMGTLWNTYAFFVLYADIDKFDPSAVRLEDCKLSLMDRWALSRLNTLIDGVEKDLDRYDITSAARAIQAFTDDLSNWYVRRGRDRYWGSEMTEDKKAAYATLYHVLVTLSEVIAPFVPFMAESIYQNLVRGFFPDAPESVHLCTWPQADLSRVDRALEERMAQVLNAVVLGRSCRNAANLKNRQPLSRMFLVSDRADLPAELLALAADELNVKKIEYVREVTDYVSYELKPQLKTLGPKYGPLIGKIRAFLAECDALAVVSAVRGGGLFRVELDGREVEFAEGDLLISSKNKEGFVAASDRGMTVVLDTNLTPELVDEGLAREIVSKIQTMRKEAGFEVTDRIRVCYRAGEDLSRVLRAWGPSIAEDVLCDRLEEGDEGFARTWEIGGESLTLALSKV